MKRLLCAIAVVVLSASVASQEPPRPTKAPIAPTAAQLDKLKAGVKLHDQGNFDDAIALYAEVLKENPDCIVALFEIANSYHQKRDYARALEFATLGAAYDSPQLASFYLAIGSAYDDMGDSAKAIDAYKRGIALAPSFLLHFNLGITLEQLTNDDDAKVQLKQSALLNPNHASTHVELGKLFMRKGLTSQGVLALSRFLVLEPASPRTGDAYRAWLEVLRRSVSTGADGKMTISVNPGYGRRQRRRLPAAGSVDQYQPRLGICAVGREDTGADSRDAARRLVRDVSQRQGDRSLGLRVELLRAVLHRAAEARLHGAVRLLGQSADRSARCSGMGRGSCEPPARQ